MEREQYEVMFHREDEHWWYAGMRQVALHILRSTLAGTAPARILDAGCGTGGTTVQLREFGGRIYGVDISADALQLAESRGLAGSIAQASVERLPFQDGSFDLVTSFEVIYHASVGNDQHALAELRRVLRGGGLLLVRLPAHDWLRGRHDELVHTRHRYSRREVQRKLRQAGFEVEFVSWANTLLFPPAAAKRLLARVMPEHGDGMTAPEPDLWQPPPLLNDLLERCLTVEALALPRRLPLPFGLSVIALGRAT